jgi:phenylpropionate dioxygenase-like ring-hydroxylating dioxygenase large terminal subunit
MRNGNADQIARLIEPGRVHRDLYTDPGIFELEMERIFGRAWLFVGHASQVPHPGDFVTTELGLQPVVMTRHRDRRMYVLLNRCTHRGAKVVNERNGNAPRLTCCYHGWSFDTDGQLAAVPVPEGCAPGFDKEHFALVRAPRVGEYRGFVFASMAAKGPSFEDHIGPIKGNIDDLVDRAPAGELALDAGMHRYTYAGNWKLQDGHGWTSNTALDDGKRSSPAFDEYRRVLAEKIGAERARDILTPRLHNSLIYPNMSIMGLNIHVRVIKPVAVDRTEVTIYPVRLIGAPDAMNFANIRLLNVTHSAASFVQTDDLEAFVRTQKGLRSRLTDWVDISRGLGDEEPDRELNATRGLATHEMVVRAQYKAWLGYMREAA